MQEQKELNFNRIANAIEYIRNHFKEQPNLEDIASHVNLSPAHFQRMFSEWAGITPKKFLQFLTLRHAKKLLKSGQASLFNTAFEAGLSSTSRLHDLFVKVEGMTPAEYKNGGKLLIINYSFADSPFGKILVASTLKGVCYMAFCQAESTTLSLLKEKFPNARFVMRFDALQQNALQIFEQNRDGLKQIKLHLKGTDFQLKVWEALLKIPLGQLSTYSSIADQINKPSASRAVGTAIGSNPVAYLIPCHRVIKSTGQIGGYMWGTTRKSAIIGWEGAQVSEMNKKNFSAIKV